jgi:hypothetical protein
MSTKQKLRKIVPNTESTRKNVSIYDDPDYGLIFEFVTGFLKNFKTISNKGSSLAKNKSLLDLIKKLEGELNSLIVSEHFLSDRPKVNVWSSDYLLEEDDYDTEGDTKSSNLREKTKVDFITRNELLIMDIVSKLVQLDSDKFCEINGMEILLFLFEKHKYNEQYLNSIGNCLCLISLDPTKKTLFLQSGWLKRLSQCCNSNFYDEKLEKESKSFRDNIKMIRELIGHKVNY